MKNCKFIRKKKKELSWNSVFENYSKKKLKKIAKVWNVGVLVFHKKGAGIRSITVGVTN